MRSWTSEKISLSAIGAGISLIFISLAFFIKNISIALNVLASVGLMLPMSKNYYKESFLAYIVASVLGFFIVNVNILSFVFLGGLFPLIVIFCSHKQISRPKRYAIYAIFSIVSFFVYFIVFKTLFWELIATIGIAQKLWLYPIANAVYFGTLILYEMVLLMIYQEVIKIIARIRR